MLENKQIDYSAKKHIKCHQCSKKFVSYGNLKRHKQIVHLGLKNYQCDFCFKWFGQPHHLAKHNIICTLETPKSSSKSSKNEMPKLTIKAELEAPSNESMHLQDFGQKGVPYINNIATQWVRREDTYFGNLWNKPIEPICIRLPEKNLFQQDIDSSQAATSFYRHPSEPTTSSEIYPWANAITTVEQATQTSDKLNKFLERPMFENIESVPTHSERLSSSANSNKKEIKCMQCNKLFVNQGNLKRHVIVVHERLRNFHCDICNRSFGQSQNLKKHLSVHSRDVSFECGLCSNKFADEYTMKRHILVVHERQKNYKCTICEKTFGQSSHLKKHIQTHNLH